MGDMTSQGSTPPPAATAKGWFDEPLTRGEQTISGGLKGIIGGAVAGYVGGGLFDRGAAQEQFLIGAVVGACIGLVFGLLEAIGRVGWGRLWGLVWLPISILGCAAVFGGKYIAAWAFGWAVQAWTHGVLAAVAGAVIGGVLGVVLGFLLWQRPRAGSGTNQPLQM